MMLEHLAIWVKDLEVMKNFYVTYFDLECGQRYHNPVKQFTSYFLAFGNGKTRIELMHKPVIPESPAAGNSVIGLAHFAIAVGSREDVHRLTERLRADGYTIAGEPRLTGDGYYESVILDPEGNSIELTAG